MTTETQAGKFENQYCESLESHEHHMCQLLTRVAAGEIIDLVDLPGYVCENCTRAANSPESLCRPRNLDDQKIMT